MRHTVMKHVANLNRGKNDQETAYLGTATSDYLPISESYN